MSINWSGRGHLYTEEEIAVVGDVMRNADPLTQGKYLQAFERDFGRVIGCARCFALTNCAHALELAAILSRVGPGDEVICPAHTYCASAIPFARAGASLVWADISPDTFLVTLESIKEIVTARTKVIVVVHLYGMICSDIREIAEFAKSRRILLVEDCAHALGATLHGQAGGTFGDFGTFSFHAQKNVTTLGEGGMLVVRSGDHAKLVPGLRHNGHCCFANQKDYWVPAMANVEQDIPGVWPHNYSLGEAQAALGSALLGRLPELTRQRRERALSFRAALQGYPELRFQRIESESQHSHHLLVAKYVASKQGRSRDDLIRLLFTKYGIKTIVQYYPLYRYELFRKTGFGVANCPQTDDFFDNMISFPAHGWMSADHFNYLIASVREALGTLRQ